MLYNKYYMIAYVVVILVPPCEFLFAKCAQYLLTFYAPTLQIGQTHSNNYLAICRRNV